MLWPPPYANVSFTSRSWQKSILVLSKTLAIQRRYSEAGHAARQLMMSPGDHPLKRREQQEVS